MAILGNIKLPGGKIDKDVLKSKMKELSQNFDYVEKHLKNKNYLVGDSLSIADLYLVFILDWLLKFAFRSANKKKLK